MRIKGRKTKGRNSYLRQKYGITLNEFEKQLELQGGVCAICDGRLYGGVVDHCHKRGHNRGILCSLCNSGIGFLRDDPNALLKASGYVLMGGVWNEKGD